MIYTVVLELAQKVIERDIGNVWQHLRSNTSGGSVATPYGNIYVATPPSMTF